MRTVQLIKKYQFGLAIEGMRRAISKGLLAVEKSLPPDIIAGTIQRMQEQYGTPYFLGNKKGHTDCSVFVGLNLYRSAFGDLAYQDFRTAGFEGEASRDPNRPLGNTKVLEAALKLMVKDGNATIVDVSLARPGDIAMWPRRAVGHVGYVIGNNRNENGEMYPIIANASGKDVGAGKASSLYFDVGETATELNNEIGYKNARGMISPKVTFYRLDYRSGAIPLLNLYIEGLLTGEGRFDKDTGEIAAKLAPVVIVR